MARPVVSPTAEDLYASLGPYTEGDEAQDWHLLKACEAICVAFVEPVAEMVQERDGFLPWERLLSPSDSPEYALSWLAQFVGATLADSMTEGEKRAAVALPEGWLRGTPAAMTQAIQRTLTGSKHVYIDERVGGSAYQLAVRTLTSQTPSEAATEAAVIGQKPGGVVLDYDAIAGATYAEVEAEYADYAALEAANPTYADVLILPD